MAGGPGVAFPSDREFHHFSLAVDAIENKSRLYVDGFLQATKEPAITSTNSGDDTRFGRQFSSSAYIEPFHGYLDNIRIYDSALTTPNISNLANNAPSVPAPAAAWLLD